MVKSSDWWIGTNHFGYLTAGNNLPFNNRVFSRCFLAYGMGYDTSLRRSENRKLKLISLFTSSIIVSQSKQLLQHCLKKITLINTPLYSVVI